MEDTINRVRELLAQRDKIDAELQALFTGTPPKEKRTSTCSHCGEVGHNARGCTKKQEA